MSYLDNLSNPLWDALLSDGAKSPSDILKFIQKAAETADNLFRLGEDGIPRKTGRLALYSGQIRTASGGFVQAGNIAQDLSLRSPDITALDKMKVRPVGEAETAGAPLN